MNMTGRMGGILVMDDESENPSAFSTAFDVFDAPV
jgi:hypothetical protein